jgi:hypothetical protein
MNLESSGERILPYNGCARFSIVPQAVSSISALIMTHLHETRDKLRYFIFLKEGFSKMFCPQCGQQQASTEMRFCSRCGFPLGGVTELLAQGGVLRSGGDELREQSLSPRYRGVRQGVIMMLIGTVVVPILGILANSYTFSSEFIEILVALSAVIFFAGGLMRILYAALFEQGAKKAGAAEYVAPVASPQPSQLNMPPRVSALPPPQSIPVPNFTPRRMNTAELAQPPSVTENTTRLLDEEKTPRTE